MSQDTSDVLVMDLDFALKFDCTTADTSIAAGEALIWRTKLEGETFKGIKKGTSDAEKITLSFYVKGMQVQLMLLNFKMKTTQDIIHKSLQSLQVGKDLN